MSLLTRKQRKVERKTTAKKLMAQGTDESEEDIVLGEWPSGPDSERDATSGERECYSIDESDKTWFVFESDSGEEEFYGFD